MKKRIFILLSVILVGCQTAEIQQPTQTPWIITATPLPTLTPTPSPIPTLTPDSISILGDDSITIEASEVTIILPPSFSVLTQDEISDSIDTLENLGGDYAVMAQTVKENPDAYLLVAFEASPDSLGRSLTILKMQDQGFEIISLDTMVQMLMSSFEDIGAIVDQQAICEKEGFECLSFKAEMTIMGFSSSTFMYVLHRGDSIYGISFQTSTEVYQDSLQEFKAIFESIQINY